MGIKRDKAALQVPEINIDGIWVGIVEADHITGGSQKRMYGVKAETEEDAKLSILEVAEKDMTDHAWSWHRILEIRKATPEDFRL